MQKKTHHVSAKVLDKLNAGLLLLPKLYMPISRSSNDEIRSSYTHKVDHVPVHQRLFVHVLVRKIAEIDSFVL